MLHPVPDSPKRARLLEVVAMQRVLMEALCALAPSSVVDVAWLKGTWPSVAAEWVEDFWNLPKETSVAGKPGKRSLWILAIAAAPAADKQAILSLLSQQLRFGELYANPPTVRLINQSWSATVFSAVNDLLESFYAPLFYKGSGYPNADGTLFHKEEFLKPEPNICPYTDGTVQDTKLDHFLPKDRFPMLSCHPDNLIPCSTDPNSGGHKGKKVPLDFSEADQAANWFHPRWRSAQNTFRLEFPAGPAPQPRVRLVALQTQDQVRLDNLEGMFGLSDFWGKFLDDELQNVAGDVDGLLSDEGATPDEANVQAKLLLLASLTRKRIGKDALAIVKSAFYGHIAQNQTLLAQVLRTCSRGT